MAFGRAGQFEALEHQGVIGVDGQHGVGGDGRRGHQRIVVRGVVDEVEKHLRHFGGGLGFQQVAFEKGFLAEVELNVDLGVGQPLFALERFETVLGVVEVRAQKGQARVEEFGRLLRLGRALLYAAVVVVGEDSVEDVLGVVDVGRQHVERNDVGLLVGDVDLDNVGKTFGRTVVAVELDCRLQRFAGNVVGRFVENEAAEVGLDGDREAGVFDFGDGLAVDFCLDIDKSLVVNADIEADGVHEGVGNRCLAEHVDRIFLIFELVEQ